MWWPSTRSRRSSRTGTHRRTCNVARARPVPGAWSWSQPGARSQPPRHPPACANMAHAAPLATQLTPGDGHLYFTFHPNPNANPNPNPNPNRSPPATGTCTLPSGRRGSSRARSTPSTRCTRSSAPSRTRGSSCRPPTTRPPRPRSRRPRPPSSPARPRQLATSLLVPSLDQTSRSEARILFRTGQAFRTGVVSCFTAKYRT